MAMAIRLSLFSFGLLAFGVMPVGRDVSSAKGADSEVVLFRKRLDDDRELVVVRGRSVPLTVMEGIIAISAENRKHITGVSSLRCEIHSATNGPLIVAHRLIYDTIGRIGHRFQVLDLLVSPERIVIAAIDGPLLVLWAITPMAAEANHCAWLNDWTRVAAMVPLDKTMVGAKLRTDDNGRIHVEIDDLRSNSKRHTEYIQAPNDWTFAKSIAKKEK
jgi:hypothetical protein